MLPQAAQLARKCQIWAGHTAIWPGTSVRWNPRGLRLVRLRARRCHRQRAYELQRRLGRQPQRHISHYTNPPEEMAADYPETMYSTPPSFLDQLLIPWSRIVSTA
jgi:hypothetical protein